MKTCDSVHAPANNDLALKVLPVFQEFPPRGRKEKHRSLQIVEPSATGLDLLSDTHSSVTFVELLTHFSHATVSSAAKQGGHCVGLLRVI